MKTYEEAKAERDRLDAAVKSASEAFKKWPERCSMNLTPDHVRALPEWRAAKKRFDQAFDELRRYNQAFVKTFAEAIRAERRK